MKSLRSVEIENIKEKLIIFKNELIRKNKINNRIKKDLDDYNGNTKYSGIKDIRFLFNEEDIYNGINDINICSMELHSMELHLTKMKTK